MVEGSSRRPPLSPFNVKRESLHGHPARLFQRIARCDAAWKIREADALVGLSIFVKISTPFGYFMSLIPPACFFYASQCRG